MVGKEMKMKIQIVGKINFQRNKNSDCACCRGNHIYGRSITKLDSSEYINIESVILCNLPEEAENKKVKILAEIIE